MKANEFIRLYGIKKAKEVLQNATWKDIFYGNNRYYQNSCGKDYFRIDDLKNLIDAHDIVSCFSEIEFTKNSDNALYKISINIYHKAIADVESCQ